MFTITKKVAQQSYNNNHWPAHGHTPIPHVQSTSNYSTIPLFSPGYLYTLFDRHVMRYCKLCDAFMTAMGWSTPLYIAPEAYSMYIRTYLPVAVSSSAANSMPVPLIGSAVQQEQSHTLYINKLLMVRTHTGTQFPACCCCCAYIHTNMCAHARTWLNLLGLDINCF